MRPYTEGVRQTSVGQNDPRQIVQPERLQGNTPRSVWSIPPYFPFNSRNDWLVNCIEG